MSRTYMYFDVVGLWMTLKWGGMQETEAIQACDGYQVYNSLAIRVGASSLCLPCSLSVDYLLLAL